MLACVSVCVHEYICVSDCVCVSMCVPMYMYCEEIQQVPYLIDG